MVMLPSCVRAQAGAVGLRDRHDIRPFRDGPADGGELVRAHADDREIIAWGPPRDPFTGHIRAESGDGELAAPFVYRGSIQNSPGSRLTASPRNVRHLGWPLSSVHDVAPGGLQRPVRIGAGIGVIGVLSRLSEGWTGAPLAGALP